MHLFIVYLLLSDPERKGFIRHLDKPPCIHCKHYIPDLNDFSSGTCGMFGGKDLLTGRILYDDATSVRQDESKCTVHGRYFVGEKLHLKKMGYHIQKNLVFLLSIGFIVSVYYGISI